MTKTRKGNLLFVGGDLSGIQKFIYNVSSKKAAVSLKGRSEYLCRYTNDVYNQLRNLPAIKKAGTTPVYCSSGKFYFITEDTTEIRAAIVESKQQIESELWHKQHGQLAISICYVPFSFAEDGKQVMVDGKKDKIGILWSAITPLFARAKKQAFSQTLQDNYAEMFEVIPVGGKVDVCAITGIESDELVALTDETETLHILPSVKEQIAIGQELRNKEHFKTFEDYADNTHLGVLRMDVDGLGTRFIRGFNDIDEYTAFSKRLAIFFDDNLRAIQQKDYYKDDLNIIYAGGDDLFAVGRWDKIIEFAADVRHQFMQHMQGESLTISGGIAIVNPKFPIAKAAILSGEAEEKAKAYVAANGNTKNAICFFDISISWEQEYDEVLQLKNEFIYQIRENGISKGLLQQLMLYAEMAQEGKLNYLWHATYYLTRMIKDRAKSDAKVFLQNLRDKHITRGLQHMRLLALAARWAEQELRIQ